MSHLVYKYWCKPATETDERLLLDQLRLAGDYRRELARIENRARILQRAIPKGDDADHQAVRERVGAAKARAKRDVRAVFVDQGLHWGTYQAADEAADQSARTTAFFDDVREWTARDIGCVAIHFQPARKLRDENDAWFRVKPGMVRHGSEFRKNGQPRPALSREVLFRVGSTGREPIWATIHVKLHRPLPDAEVVWVRVKRHRIATKYRWELHVTLKADQISKAKSMPPRPHAAGVDIGWRKLDGKTRIAYWWGTDGRSGELSISSFVLGRDDKSDSLRAIRDDNRNKLQAALVEFRRTLPESSWLFEATTSLWQWRKTGRFFRLLREWRGSRLTGDAAAFLALEAWAKQDRHLHEWEANNRDKRRRHVEEQIRQMAVFLARNYGRIGIEAPFVARLVKRAARCEACKDLPKRCDACREDDRLRKLAATRVPHAAPARTRSEIETFAKSYGAVAIRIDPAYTTLDCAHCGWRREEVTDWSLVEIACPSCGVIEDQDLTAAKNLARSASAAVLGEDGRPLDPMKSPTSKRKLGVRQTRKRRIVTPLETSGASG